MAHSRRPMMPHRQSTRLPSRDPETPPARSPEWRESSFLSEPQLLGDDVALDVVGPGVDQAADAVAEVALDAGLVDIARGAEELDGVEAVLDEAFRDVELGHRRLERGVLPLRLEPADLVDQGAARLQPQLHRHDPVRDRLELADRLAELLATPGVVDAALELPAHRAEGGGQDRPPLPLHRAVEDLRPPPFAAEEVGDRQRALLEGELAHRHRPDAHLLDLAHDPEAGGVAGYEEGAEAQDSPGRVGRRIA